MADTSVLPTRTNKKYGWVPDLPDHRDLLYFAGGVSVPSKTDLTAGMPAVYDQGNLGSCTGNAIAAQFDYEWNKTNKKFETPSRLFIYYNERVIEGTVDSDSGAMGRDGIKSLKATGVCPESEWPYVVSKFADKPSAKCYTDATKFEVLTYKSVPHTLAALKAALAEDHPISFGFTVYQSFESDEVAKTGIVPMPGKNETTLGGHEVVIVGHDDSKQLFKCRNSWGKSWGDNGYFYMPYKYISSKLCSSFWIIETVK